MLGHRDACFRWIADLLAPESNRWLWLNRYPRVADQNDGSTLIATIGLRQVLIMVRGRRRWWMVSFHSDEPSLDVIKEKAQFPGLWAVQYCPISVQDRLDSKPN